MLKQLRRKLIFIAAAIFAAALTAAFLVSDYFKLSFGLFFIAFLALISMGGAVLAVVSRRRIIQEIEDASESVVDESLFFNENLLVGRGFTNGQFQKIGINTHKDGLMLLFFFGSAKKPISFSWDMISGIEPVGNDPLVTVKVDGVNADIILPCNSKLFDAIQERLY